MAGCWRSVRRAAALLAMMVLLPALASAESAACSAAPARVTGVHAGLPATDNPAPPSASARSAVPVVGLGDTITLTVSNLAALFEEAACRGSGAPIVLFLDGRPVPGIAADPPSDPALGQIAFPLRRTPRGEAVWTSLLGAPTSLRKTLSVSIGLGDRFALPSTAGIAFAVVDRTILWIWLALLALAFLLFTWLAVGSDMLRDATADPRAGERPGYSLGRVQAALWFFVVLVGWLFVAMVTGDYLNAISGGALGVLGLSAATAGASATIDLARNTPKTRDDARTAIDTVQQAATARAAALAAAQPLPNAVTPALADDLVKRARRENRGFLLDILSDANGVSFHRYQLLVWTVVLAAVFAYVTWRDLALPPLDTGLLGTYFVSAATFIGLKVPEPVVPRPLA